MINNYLKSNKTVVISSHQIHEIEKLITRVIFIFNGENKLDILVDELKNLVLLETIDPCFSAKIKPKYAFISNNKYYYFDCLKIAQLPLLILINYLIL